MSKNYKSYKEFNKSILCITVGSILMLPGYALAEEVPNKASEAKGIEVIQVTASRRSSSVQSTPLNVTALDSDVMKDQNISSPEDVARWVPGLTISDQGGRESATIIVRGLNTTSSDRESDGGTVATYLGEVPLRADFRLKDMERVEVLIGPQGTLYGGGSLAGAIRYIPNKPELDITEGSITGDIFSLNESDGTGKEIGFVFNTPIIEDKLAVRFNVNYYDSPGYVDYNYLLKEVGVSSPDPDWNDDADISANLKQKKDANDESTTTARVSLRWNPSDWFNGTLNYFYQKQDAGGNSIVQQDTLSTNNRLFGQVGQFESVRRFEEPNENKDTLLSLELEFDLDFAQLVSATGKSTHKDDGLRDQTDLLMDIYSGYADFPAFSHDQKSSDTFTQELRLISKSESDFSWIVGYYYNKLKDNVKDREYTIGITDAWFNGTYTNIERDLEYIDVNSKSETEQAIFGEIAYQISDKWSVTLGTRIFEYDLSAKADNHAPFYDGPVASIDDLVFQQTSAKGNDTLYKFNTGYQFTADVMSYFTISEGFRLGGANALPACDGSTQVCALPHELDYDPDKTVNTELGIKSSWLNNRLHLNAAIFNVGWDDAQVSSVTQNGAVFITTNAGSANSKGVELSTRAMLGDSFTTYMTYSFAKAELTEAAPNLFGSISTPGSALQNHYDGADGDRLPGAPEHQFSLGVDYETEVMGDKLLNISYGLTAQSDVYTKAGLKADGEILPGYALSNLSAKLSNESWSVTLYINNLFDKYANTSVRRDKSWAGNAKFSSQNRGVDNLQRAYGHYITKPRTIGVRFNYNFEL
ncbi:TonB-dependent receptor [Colwellia sp. MB02u-10]|uniref:TonB-dependent receptor n=1 Tax=Colwellia sp. MB02u-10 TaxID=2759828 RepID=UPI0015F42FE4|nr:TonB-dependent receptor [Colwellia sp. MB02u-10]MBA6341121.1 TonB-dependent receptor [Colwellia sp. MB02u-10]